jgi:hypothetical protein
VIPVLTSSQPEIQFDIKVAEPGEYVLVVHYVTKTTIGNSSALDVRTKGEKKSYRGRFKIYSCYYTWPCRQVAVDKLGRVAVFSFDTNIINILLTVSTEY